MIATTIATISMFLAIIILQHLYNWVMRKTHSVMEEYGLGIYIMATFINGALTFGLAKLIIDINK